MSSTVGGTVLLAAGQDGVAGGGRDSDARTGASEVRPLSAVMRDRFDGADEAAVPWLGRFVLRACRRAWVTAIC